LSVTTHHLHSGPLDPGTHDHGHHTHEGHGHGGMTPDGSAPLVDPKYSMRDITDDVLAPMFKFPPLAWHMAFGAAQLAFAIGAVCVAVQMIRGLGILGINNPIGWGVYITDFVFWVGIGHAGTLISAILFLFRQKWRTAINRSAEAMTIFAVMCAGLFPLLHVGRTWKAYWLFPYPNDRLLWVNFRSPLLWDVFAVSTYATVSMIFWYTGLIPDMATARDRAKNKIQKAIYGVLAMNWTGSVRDWAHYERVYARFAWLATPLVLSVHSVVSFDFAVSMIPGWHTTIFPPYFVAGAIFSGFGMVITLLVPMRKFLRLEHIITVNHLELCNKVILATSLIVGYAYISEFFVAWYSEAPYERAQFMYRLIGLLNTPDGGIAHMWAFWTMMICNVMIPQLFWSKRIRRHLTIMFIISIFVNIGMWFERFNIFVLSLEHDFLPASWGYYRPTLFDWGVTLGSFGLFFTLFLGFSRVLPTIAIAEVKSVLHRPNAGGVERPFEVVVWPDGEAAPSHPETLAAKEDAPNGKTP
jgi:molybdopterin-containing oxidoreductase family membrane subunit